MAHVMKIKAGAVRNMVGHYGREAERERGYERDNIDPERMHLNYEVGDPDADLAAEIERCRQIHNESGRALRGDAVVLADWVITLPKNVPEERAREFFERTLRFLQARYGKENVMVGYVHMDERTPHMHVPVIPFDRERGRFQASKMIDRADLQTFHKDLGRALERDMGFRPGVELDEDQKRERAGKYVGLAEYKDAKEAEERARAEEQRARAEAVMEAERLERLRQESRSTERQIQVVEREADKIDPDVVRERAAGQAREALADGRGLGRREEELRRDVERLRGDLGASEERNGELAKEAGELRGRIEGCEREKRQIDDGIGGLEQGVRLLREKVDRLKERIGVVREQLERVRERLGHLLTRGPWHSQEHEIDRGPGDGFGREFDRGDRLGR